MTVFAADHAKADLNDVEEGVLRGLASLGYNANVEDVREFAAGFTHSLVTPAAIREALLNLDALGWVRPDHGEPLTASVWMLRSQGRVALERVNG